MRIKYEQVIQNLSLLTKLDEFDPIPIGTPPLGIEVETSDVDIACSATDLEKFKAVAATEYGGMQGYQCRHSNLQDQDSVVIQFYAYNWEIELFCQPIPTRQQWGVRHSIIEQRIFEIEPELKRVVLQLKREGQKTEPAFSFALGLSGDPYVSLLELEKLSNAELTKLIAERPEDV